jgi:1-acyl-sn-glycerol-3-phosphate acyltransferase
LVAFVALQPLARFLYRLRVRRCRHLPEGPCILASNHRSFADPMLVGMFHHYPIAYFARASLWHNPVIAFFLRVMYGIPVDREHPGLSSSRGAVERLRQGISVLVFPEGTRTRDGRLSPMRDGPALFARRANVPVVPIYLHRSERIWPRSSFLPRLCGTGVEIRFGRPLIPPPGLETREQDAWVTRRLQAWMELQERRLMGLRREMSPEVRKSGSPEVEGPRGERGTGR